MFVSLLVSTSLVSAITVQHLNQFCPNGYSNWTDVTPRSEWYWGADWEDFQKNGTIPGGYSGLHPAGFREYTLPWYNEPPICLLVPGSHDKKIEVLIESDVENANLCVHDAKDLGVSLNDVGDVNTCGQGQVYACFTAATQGANDNGRGKEDFGFYVSCNGGCPEMDTRIWIRVRLSDQDWDTGKTGVQDDLEMWCENEKGVLLDENADESDTNPKMFTYPSELIPSDPSSFPFHIKHFMDYSAGGYEPVTRFNFLLPILAIFCLACLVVN